MNVAILGLWHLGSVTAACAAAAGHSVRAWDPDPGVVDRFARAVPAVKEPGLAELVAGQIAGGRLRAVADVAEAVSGADVAWITFDTPVDEDDNADVAFVLDQV